MDALFFIVPGLVTVVGLLHIFFPAAAWRLRRRYSRSMGLAVADEPEPADLLWIRVQGAVLATIAIGVMVFAWRFFAADWRGGSP